MRLFALASLLLAGAAAAAPQSAAVLPTSGHPFASLPVEGGLIVSVTSNGQPGSETGLRVFTGATPQSLASSCLQPVDAAQALGLAASPDGRTLVVAAGDAGLKLLDSAAVMAGCHAKPITVPLGAASSRQGSLDVAVTPDGRFAFVANEYGVASRDSSGQDVRGHVAVVALSYDAAGAPTGGRIVNRIATGGAAIAGLALSPDGRRLYVTSEVARQGARAANGRVPVLAHGGCRQGDGPAQPFGLLSVIDVAGGESGAANAVVAATAAGCSPVRGTVSPDGRTVWVAARGDDRVLAFSAASLESDPAHALLGAGDSGGKAPVGLALFAGGRRLAVANSNRFGGARATGNLALLNADPAKSTVTSTVAATYFPRSISVAKDGRTLFLTDYNGGQVQVIPTD